MTGPAVALIGTASSAAITWARLVLPTPGGPKSSTWSRASPRLRAASIATRRLGMTCPWPTYPPNRGGARPRAQRLDQLRGLDPGEEVNSGTCLHALLKDNPELTAICPGIDNPEEGERV